MSNKVIQTILSLKDEMSGQLKIAAKATENARKQLEEAKKEIDKHRQASVKNTEVLKQAKAEVTDLKKIQSMYRSEIARAEQQIKDLSNQTSRNKKEMKENKLALDAAKQSLDSLKQAQNQTKIAIANAQNEVGKHEEALKASNKMIEQARTKAKQYGKIIAETSGKIKEAKETVKSWGKSAFSSMDAVIKKSLLVGSAFITATSGLSLGAAGTVGLTEAIDLEGYRTQLDTATKDTKKASMLMSNAVQFANETPFQTGHVVEATAKMEAYSVSSQKWLKDIADMAGATNREILDATDAVIDARKGEYEGLEGFGIDKEMLMANAAKIYGENIVFDKKGQVKKIELLETVLQKTMQEKFANGALKQAQTMKGTWSTILGVTKTSLANILGMTNDGTIRQGSLYQVLKDKMQIVVNLLDKWHKDGTIKMIGEQVTQVVLVIINVVTRLYNLFMKYKEIIFLVIKVVGTLYLLIKAIIFVTAVVKVLSTVLGVLKIIWMVLNLVIGMSPLGIIVLGIMAIVAAGFILMKVLQGIWNLASKAFNVIKKVLGFGKNKVEVEKKEKTETDIKQKVIADFESPKIEDFNIGSSMKVPKIEEINNLGMPKIEIPKVNGEKQKIISNNNEKTNNNNSKQEHNIINNFNGDIYGFDAFTEKVAEAIMKMTSMNKVNVTGG